MLTGIFVLLAVLFWALGLGILVIVMRTAILLRRPDAPVGDPPEGVAVIIPCRGVDPEFSALLAGLAAQDLPDYHLYFVVAAAEDVVVPVINAFLAEHPGLGELVHFPPPPRFDGKIANMVGGMRAALAAGASYLVFLDSDTVPGPSFLTHLVEPLVRGGAMLSSGARLLTPADGRVPQWVGSLMVQGSLPGVADPQRGGAWGGAMAMRAADVGVLQPERVWADAFSDDATLSRAVREAGGRIAFAPSCIVANPIYGGWPDTIDFMTRQTLVLRAHERRLWYVAWGMLYPLVLGALVGIELILGEGLLALATAAAMLPTYAALYLVNEAAWRRAAMPEVRLLSQPLFTQLALLAVLPVVLAITVIRSARIRQFPWRGQMYEMAGGRFRRLSSSESAES